MVEVALCNAQHLNYGVEQRLIHVEHVIISIRISHRGGYFLTQQQEHDFLHPLKYRLDERDRLSHAVPQQQGDGHSHGHVNEVADCYGVGVLFSLFVFQCLGDAQRVSIIHMLRLRRAFNDRHPDSTHIGNVDFKCYSHVQRHCDAPSHLELHLLCQCTGVEFPNCYSLHVTFGHSDRRWHGQQYEHRQ